MPPHNDCQLCNFLQPNLYIQNVLENNVLLETRRCTSYTFLDMHEDERILTLINDTRDEVNFSGVNFPILSSKMPSASSWHLSNYELH